MVSRRRKAQNKSMEEQEIIYPQADDHKSGYDADCRFCYRGKVHTAAQHEKSLAASFEAFSDPRNQGISVRS